MTLRSDPFDPRNPGSPGPAAAGRYGGRFGGFRRPPRPPDHLDRERRRPDLRPSTATGRRRPSVEPVPFSGGLILEGSDKSLEALIAETERALLVTRFWYIRNVNPQNATVTGLTRDGVWLVEKGKIVHPVNNFRFNDSPVNLLKNLEATSVPVPPAAASSPR